MKSDSPATAVQIQRVAQLLTLFGEQCRSRNRRYLHRRVAWQLQADDEGATQMSVVDWLALDEVCPLGAPTPA